MKNSKVIFALGLGIASIGIFSQTVSAEDAKTNGSVSFAKPDNPDPNKPFTLVKPGTNNEWITIPKGVGSLTTDPTFGFSFIPSLNFGVTEVVTYDQYKFSETSIPYQSYDITKKDYFNEKDGRPVKYLPPFLQVVNLRGTSKPYQVGVKASKFTYTGENGAVLSTLENTAIEVKDFTLRNNLLDKVADTDAVSILTANVSNGSNAGYTRLRANETIDLMRTKEGKGKETDGSASSLVFANDYKSTKTDYPNLFNKTKDKPDYESIRLFIPSGDTPEAERQYKATLTWELKDVE